MSTKIWNKEYPSASTADFTGNLAAWVQCVGSGTVVLTNEDGSTFTKHASGGEVYPGSFSALVSTTCTYVVIGNGVAPTPAPLAGVAASDVRLNTIEALVSFSGSDGSLTEQPFPHPAFACTLVGVYVEAPAAAAASDTNYVTITFAKRNGSGGGATTLVAGTTQATGGVNAGGGLLAFQFVSLGTPSATAIAAADVLTIKSVKTSSGVAIGPSIVRLVYSVP